MAEMLLRASSEKELPAPGEARPSLGKSAACYAGPNSPGAPPKLAPRERAHVPFAALAMMLAFALSASGCQVVEGIFKAGFWVGVVVVIAVLALLVFAVSKLVR
jgi:hypothetical protein